MGPGLGRGPPSKSGFVGGRLPPLWLHYTVAADVRRRFTTAINEGGAGAG
jgi:hypothetical protein